MLAVRGVGEEPWNCRTGARSRATPSSSGARRSSRTSPRTASSTTCRRPARLRLTAFAALPDRFDLFIFETRRTYKAAVQWRAGDQAGVVFEQASDLDDTLVTALVDRMQHLETVVQDLAAMVADLRGVGAKAAG